MTSSDPRIQMAEVVRERFQGLANASYGDPQQAEHLLEISKVDTARTECERRTVCDLAWAMIDSEPGWRMHKKLACLKYVWTVTVTMEYRALVHLSTEALHELMEQAGGGYDHHLATKNTRRRGRVGARVSATMIKKALAN